MSDLIGMVKEAAQLAGKLEQRDLQAMVLDLQSIIMEKMEEWRKTKQENQDLIAALQFSGSLELEQQWYWALDEKGNKNGPYCVPCWDKFQRRARLFQVGRQRYRCPSCDNGFRGKDADPDPQIIVRG
ncbi:hypothetical protein KJ682_08775 [bacterium]|nr:hypothetical protein [bacterium]